MPRRAHDRRPREQLIRLEGRIEAIAGREAELATTLEREEHELEAAVAALAALADGSAGEDIEPAIVAATAAEQAWRVAVAELAAADDELLAAEQAVSELRARHSDLIASRARASEEAARHRARLEQALSEQALAEASVAELRSRSGAGRTRPRAGIPCGRCVDDGARGTRQPAGRGAGGGRCFAANGDRADRAPGGASRRARRAR